MSTPVPRAFIWSRRNSAIRHPFCATSARLWTPATSPQFCFASRKADERTLTNRAKAVATAVQRRDVALLLDGHPELAARAGADGAHLTGIEALTSAIPTLKPDRIAGAGGLRSRHDAMLAGEAGADYVMFGDPDQQRRPSAFRRDRGAA